MSTKPIPEGKPVEGDMTAALDSRFLNSYVLMSSLAKSGKEHLVVTIDRVEHHESLKYESGKTDKDVDLIYFKNSDKPLKLNPTNRKRIINLLGTQWSDWASKKVAIGIEKTYSPNLGAIGPCVRVLMIDPATGRKPEAF